MKWLVLSGLVIGTLGVNCVFAVQNANTASKASRPAASISGGSTTTPGGAIIGGTVKNVTSRKSVSRKKQHRRPRRHAKKS